jgi:hypothetical protein
MIIFLGLCSALNFQYILYDTGSIINTKNYILAFIIVIIVLIVLKIIEMYYLK